MIYEYCNEIKNSGIVHADGICNSCLEMGIMIEAEFTNTMNNIFHEAGVVELNQYKKNILTEATEKNVLKSVAERIKKALQVVWEKIKGAFEWIINKITTKIDEHRKKFGEEFSKLNLNDYKDKLESSRAFKAKQENDPLIMFSTGDAAKVEKDIDEAKKSLVQEGWSSKMTAAGLKFGDFAANSYGTLLAKAFNDKKIVAIGSDVSKAKEAINAKIGIGEKDYSVDWIIKHQSDISDIIKAYTVGEVKKSYADCKKALDTAVKEISKFERNDADDAMMQEGKNFIQASSKITIAYLNCKLHFADLRLKALSKALLIAGKCVHICKTSKKDDKATAKTESALKFDTDFVNEAFNW